MKINAYILKGETMNNEAFIVRAYNKTEAAMIYNGRSENSGTGIKAPHHFKMKDQRKRNSSEITLAQLSNMPLSLVSQRPGLMKAAEIMTKAGNHKG